MTDRLTPEAQAALDAHRQRAVARWTRDTVAAPRIKYTDEMQREKSFQEQVLEALARIERLLEHR